MAALLLLLLLAPAWSCPRGCRCGLDKRGRRTVGCSQGGGKDPMPLPSITDHTEVFEVAPPRAKPNFYTIGPIFQGHKMVSGAQHLGQHYDYILLIIPYLQLEEIHIVHSNIPAIGLYSFYGLVNLQVLNLTHNNMTAVFDNNFRGLTTLRELHLSENRIESAPSSAFMYLKDLRILNLARNRIKELASRVFHKLDKLHELDLSYNPLPHLSSEVFKDVPVSIIAQNAARDFRPEEGTVSTIYI